jgi:hypothetical protein
VEERKIEEYEEPEWMIILKRIINENQKIFKEDYSRRKEINLPQALTFPAK